MRTNLACYAAETHTRPCFAVDESTFLGRVAVTTPVGFRPAKEEVVARDVTTTYQSAHETMRTTAFPPTVTDEFPPFRETHFTSESAFASAPFEAVDGVLEGPSLDAVAALSTERVVSMTRRELIEVIRSVRGNHLLPGVRERLPQMDGETLRRLVFLTRRYCRNRQRLSADAAAGVAVSCC